MAMKKKDRARDESFIAFVVEQLDALGGVRSKSMFGGYGIYSRDKFFACVDEGRLYFRVDDRTRPRYVELGMAPFAPVPSMVMKSYYEVPVDIIEASADLVRWARDAMNAVPAKKPKATGKKGGTAKKSAARKKPAVRSAKKTASRAGKRAKPMKRK